MSARYQLPEALGGAVCEFVAAGGQQTDGWLVELITVMPGLRLEIPHDLVVAITPDEPPDGSTVVAGGDAYQRRDNDNRAWWWRAGRSNACDWLTVCSKGVPVLLVPGPEALS